MGVSDHFSKKVFCPYTFVTRLSQDCHTAKMSDIDKDVWLAVGICNCLYLYNYSFLTICKLKNIYIYI